MKKLLLFSSILSFSALSAQVIVEDNFDAYTTGSGPAAQSSNWTTWDGSLTYDGLVTDEQAFSAPNSVKISGTNNDLVLPLGPYTSGSYEATFKMYIPNGEGAYFNALHNWSETSTSYQWAIDVFFWVDGTISTVAGGSDVESTTLFTHDTWFDVKLEVNLDSDNAKLKINNETITEWQWSVIHNTGAAGNNQLVALDFYGTEGSSSTNASGTYYIDDMKVEQVPVTANVASLAAETSKASFYPNPANNEITIESPASFENGVVQIFDLAGRVVMSYTLSTQTLINKVNISNLSQGIYLVQWKKGTSVATQRLVKK